MLLRFLGLCFSLLLALRAFAQPIVHLNFDDPLNLTADSSGHGHNGQANGQGQPGAHGQGVAGGAAHFNGDSFVSLDESVANVLSGDYTISLWVETTAVAGSDTDTADLGLGIVALGGESVETTVALNGAHAGFEHANENATLHSQSPINTGNFVHVVVSRDATTGEQSLFINGVLEANNHGSATSQAVHNILALGGNPGQNQFFTGAIDDFQVYNQALHASDVAFLHANPGSAVIQSLAIPEPPAIALLASGALFLGWKTVRRRRRTAA